MLLKKNNMIVLSLLLLFNNVVSAKNISSMSNDEYIKMFNDSSYKQLVKLLWTERDSINDTLRVVLCGSLLNTNDYDKLGEIIFTHNYKCGYLLYVRGMFFYNRKSWECAKERFLQAPFLNPLIDCDERVYYYLTLCSYNSFYTYPDSCCFKRDFIEYRDNYLGRYCKDKYIDSCSCNKIKILGDVPSK